MLAALLDDGTGRIRPELAPFAEAFCQMKRPRGGMTWIGRPHVREMLRTLADPGTPVTHETLNGMSPWRSVAYLRDLLMLHGVLPPADRNLMLFERWLGEALAGDQPARAPPARRAVRLLARPPAAARLRGRGPVTGKQTQQARDEVRLAIAFLAWLHGRGRALADCRQADVDAWYAGGYTARRLTHAFLRWADEQQAPAPAGRPAPGHRQPGPDQPAAAPGPAPALLTDEEPELLTRVAAVLMLLYAQPLTRILGLTLDDIRCDDGEVTIRLGDPPAPVPEPFASLLLRHAGQRLNLTTATNADARWLFPGRRGGQPMTPDTIERRLRRAGIPARGGRSAALRHLVLQAPAPVIATMLGYSHQQDRPGRRRGRQPVEPLRTRSPRPAADQPKETHDRPVTPGSAPRRSRRPLRARGRHRADPRPRHVASPRGFPVLRPRRGQHHRSRHRTGQHRLGSSDHRPQRRRNPQLQRGKRMLRLAASLAGDVPVQLGNAVTGERRPQCRSPGRRDPPRLRTTPVSSLVPDR